MIFVTGWLFLPACLVVVNVHHHFTCTYDISYSENDNYFIILTTSSTIMFGIVVDEIVDGIVDGIFDGIVVDGIFDRIVDHIVDGIVVDGIFDGIVDHIVDGIVVDGIFDGIVDHIVDGIVVDGRVALNESLEFASMADAHARHRT